MITVHDINQVWNLSANAGVRIGVLSNSGIVSGGVGFLLSAYFCLFPGQDVWPLSMDSLMVIL